MTTLENKIFIDGTSNILYEQYSNSATPSSTFGFKNSTSSFFITHGDNLATPDFEINSNKIFMKKPISLDILTNLSSTNGDIWYDNSTAKISFKENNTIKQITPHTLKGDIATTDGTTQVVIPAGSNGYVLTVDSSEASGLKWIPNTGGAIIVIPLTSKGDIFINNGISNTRLPVGSNGTILTADSTQPNGLTWNSPNTIGFTNKGDILAYNGIAQTVVPVGENNTFLSSDSTVSSGISWKSPLNMLTSKGEMLIHNGVTPTSIPVGTDNYILTADSTTTTGISWKEQAPAFGDWTIVQNNTTTNLDFINNGTTKMTISI
jgi:hypothetical protein